MLSSLASWIKQHVFITITSASSSESVSLEAMLYQKTQHMLGIYQVFIASKGNKQNFHIIQLLAPLLFPLPLQLQIPEGL